MNAHLFILRSELVACFSPLSLHFAAVGAVAVHADTNTKVSGAINLDTEILASR